MTDYQLPPLPEESKSVFHSPWKEICHWSESPIGSAANQAAENLDNALFKFAQDYARTATAPLLQDLAAHEASNRIKTENLETLREQNAKLREALVAMAHYGECTVSAFSSGRPYLDMTLLPRLCFDARAALGESE